jgi:hypothetical protein
MDRPLLLKSITALLASSKTSLGKTEGPAPKLWIIAVVVFTVLKIEDAKKQNCGGMPQRKAGYLNPAYIVIILLI